MPYIIFNLKKENSIPIFHSLINLISAFRASEPTILSLIGQLKKRRIFTHDPAGIRTNDSNFQAAEKN